MALNIVVPALGESVSEASVGNWSVKVGDLVQADQILVEIETEKITLEVIAPQSGMIKEILISKGSTVEIGSVLAVLEPMAVEAAQPAKATQDLPKEAILSPAAKKLADEAGLAPKDLQGTGKDGRVMKSDVLKATTLSSRKEERVPLSKLRKTIAKRLKEAQNTAAILTTFNEVDMSFVMSLRDRHKEAFEKKHVVKLGFMSFFVKAAVQALREIPAVNAQLEDDEIIYKNYYDIGVAVGTEQGLVVPVLRNTEHLSFSQVEQEIGILSKKARDGKLTIEDLKGGTFTISNGGVYGSLMSTPILNPPQSGILGMHKIQNRPIALGDQVVIRPMMYLALSYDHRLVDGKEAVTFLVRIKELLEAPERLLLDL